MSLNIKNPETHQLVKELATLKGVSLTNAVNLAVLNEIEREKASRKANSVPKKRSEVLREFAERWAHVLKDGPSGIEIINELYDEKTGLPK